MRRRLVAGSEHFEELSGKSFQAMAARVRELGIDLLVDLKGATYDTLLPVLAQRPAPLQATWLGFPGTTGAPYIDYLIGDRVVSPLENAAHFGEKIAQLPHCYQSNDARRALPQPSSRADWGVPDDALLLCAFHQSYKISAAVFDQWCALLHALPGSVLWLLQWNANVEAALTAAAAARGIGAERLVFAPLLPLRRPPRPARPGGRLPRHLAVQRAHHGGRGALGRRAGGDDRRRGVRPARRLEPAPHRGRARARRADVPSYCATVVALAGDGSTARRARRASRERRARPDPLFDGARFAADIERLYMRMWARCVAGERPDHLAALDAPLPSGSPA
jgi:predicted O-linked N-acetylglucosamine transferase (SPINDLY family)